MNIHTDFNYEKLYEQVTACQNISDSLTILWELEEYKHLENTERDHILQTFYKLYPQIVDKMFDRMPSNEVVSKDHVLGIYPYIHISHAEK